MKTKSTKEWIAIGCSLAVLTFVLFGNAVINFFNPQQVASSMEASQNPGVQVQDTVVGKGDVASPGDTVTVHYVGQLTSGKIFDSSLDRGEPFTFTLGVGQVIRGWDEGVAGMRVGGTRRLIISPEYAYGENGVGPIPPNATLVFDVQLLGVQKPR
ncbi:FKBP-type peptidyl-prolyl cis-trans isomerase [Candidatus Parcubacteria bacterium]|nr:FKBP-type peptidyl-prolyl cis-trans isomerase [Candidatus Parcubacteria bacterium]